MLLCVYRGPDTVINEAYDTVNQTSVAANEPVRDPDTVINEAYNAVNQTSVAANEPVRDPDSV